MWAWLRKLTEPVKRRSLAKVVATKFDKVGQLPPKILSIYLRRLDCGERQMWQLSPRILGSETLREGFTNPANVAGFPRNEQLHKVGPHPQPHSHQRSAQLSKTQNCSLSVYSSSYMTDHCHELSICLTSTPTIFLLLLPSQLVVSQKVIWLPRPHATVADLQRLRWGWIQCLHWLGFVQTWLRLDGLSLEE